MAIAGRLVDLHADDASARRQDDALSLARRLPALTAAAREISAAVMHGVHGRRRAGVGETFWQFRPFSAGESAQRIDWRRSARDDRLFVREREWEAAHTIWLWMDRAAPMTFQSSLALQSKADRAIVLGLAVADLLVRGGERVGLLGVTRPMAVRNIIERLAESMLHDEQASSVSADESLPPAEILAPRTRAVLISDFLIEPERLDARLAKLASRGARGHCLMIADPAEDAFPFKGHIEFFGVGVPDRFRAGRAETYRDDYLARLREHREAIAQVAHGRGYSLSLHRTDRPASEALLALRVRLDETAAEGAFA